LVGSVSMYDHGNAVTQSPSLRGLRKPPKLVVAAADLQRLGVPNGTEVHVASAKGSFNVTVHAMKGVPQGVAQLAMGADHGANALIDAATVVTDVRVETIR
jgi:anaerobic selenocysteine-containing dehydrogenase